MSSAETAASTEWASNKRLGKDGTSTTDDSGTTEPRLAADISSQTSDTAQYKKKSHVLPPL